MTSGHSEEAHKFLRAVQITDYRSMGNSMDLIQTMRSMNISGYYLLMLFLNLRKTRPEG